MQISKFSAALNSDHTHEMHFEENIIYNFLWNYSVFDGSDGPFKQNFNGYIVRWEPSLITTTFKPKLIPRT